MKIRLVTLNTGLIRLFGGRLEPAPYLEERLEMLPAELDQLGAEVIALQEVFDPRHQQHLTARLAHSHPHVATTRPGKYWRLGSGLMVLSSLPLESHFTSFRANLLDEWIFVDRGVLACRFTDASNRSWNLLNVHTTAGGSVWHPESRRADSIRSRQLHQMLEIAACSSRPTLLAGDFNAGPGVSEANFRLMEQGGYISLLDRIHTTEPGPTWDPLNPLNAKGPHRQCPPQRIDHVFAGRADLETARVRPVAGRICADQAVVSTPAGFVTISDHYGVSVDLELQI